MASGRPNPPLIVNNHSAVAGAWLCRNVYPCAQLPAYIPVKYQVVTQFHAEEPPGSYLGSVFFGSLTIYGRVDGNVTATERVQIAESGCLHGDVSQLL